MPLYITLILHTIIGGVTLVTLIYWKAVPSLLSLFRENINFSWPGFGIYASLFLIERAAQATINYATQFVLHIWIGLPYFHQLPAPWCWLMPLSFFLTLPLYGWVRFYRFTWHPRPT
ncbi:MAG: hypothetical protein WCW66_04065 [Patescibacteria group bacterium]